MIDSSKSGHTAKICIQTRPLDRQEKSSRDAVARSVWPADPSLAAWRCWPQKQDSAPRRIRHAAVDSNSRGGRWRSGGLAKKVRLRFAVSDQQPRMPAGADLPAAVADLTHLIFVAMPMPPEFRVGTDLDCADPLGGFRRLKPRAHEIGSQYRPSFP